MPAALAFEATEANWIVACRAANLLAREGYAPFWATRPFAARALKGGEVAFGAGAFVLQGKDAERMSIETLKDRFGVDAVELAEADGLEGLAVKPIRIAMYGGGGAPYNHAAAFVALGFLLDWVFPTDILAGALADYDIFVVPGGGCSAMMGQLDPLGDDGCRRIADFVRNGGMYMGSCAGAFDASLVSEAFTSVCPQQKRLQMINAAVWNAGDEWLGLQSPGVGVLRARVAASDHPVAVGMPDELDITHYNGPLYALKQGTVVGASDAVGVLAVVGTGADFTAAERFLDAKVADDDLLVEGAVQAGAFNAVAGEYGEGRVVLFGSHPEFGLTLDLEAWDAPARLMANAALWQAGHSANARQEASPLAPSVEPEPAANALRKLDAKLDAVVDAAEALMKRDASGAGWLSDALAMSTFGVSGADIWKRNLSAFRPMAARIRATVDEMKAIAERAKPRAASAKGPQKEALRASLDAFDRAISHRTPEEWGIDFGYEGVLQQLDRAEAMLRTAQESFEKPFEKSTNAYAYIAESPYHLAVGSYLSAAGVFGNCYLTLRLQKSQLENALALGAAEKELVH